MSNIIVGLLSEQYKLEVLGDYLLQDLDRGTVGDHIAPLGAGEPIKPRTEKIDALVDDLLDEAGLDAEFKEDFLADVVVDTQKIEYRKPEKKRAYWAKKLTESDVREIKRALKVDSYHGQQRHLAWKFGVTQENIWAIKNGKIFAHV